MKSAWLIEHPNSMASPRYASLCDGELRWTSSPYKAFQISRLEDAKAFVDVFLGGHGHPSEHGFYDD